MGYGYHGSLSGVYDAVGKGIDNDQKISAARAMRTAGAAMAGGNYDAASQSLFAAGLINEGVTIQNIPQEQAKAQAGIDYTKAATQNFQDDNARAAAKQKWDQQAQEVKIAQQSIQGLQQALQSGADVTSAWNTISSAYGDAIPDSVKTAVAQGLQRDPKGTIAALSAHTEKQYQFLQSAAGIFRGNPATGELTQMSSNPQKPIELDPTKNIYMPDQSSGAPAAGQAAAPAAVGNDAAASGTTPLQSLEQVAGNQGWRVTSAARTAAQQQHLVDIGATRALPANDPHVNLRAIDIAPAHGMSAQSIMDMYAQHGVQVHVIDETAPGQGTGPHFHVEFKGATGGGNAPQAASPAAGAASGAPTTPGAVPGYHLVQAAQPKPEDAGLDSGSVEMYAQSFLRTGQIPALGQGKSAHADRIAILNKAHDIETATGKTGEDAVATWAGTKANTQALTQVQKQYSMARNFEQTALLNADNALRLAPKGAGPLSPALNQYIQGARKNLQGSPDVTAYDVAIGTFLTEYAKIMSGSTGAQGSTDSARREAGELLNRYASRGQLAAGITVMKQDMANRMSGYEGETQRLQGAISGRPAPAAAHPAAALRSPAAPAAKRGVYDPKQGKIVWQ
jgi:hypothetical protein